MQPNYWVKSILHAVSAAMCMSFSLATFGKDNVQASLILLAGLAMVILAWKHHRIWQSQQLKTSIFFMAESLVLAFIAWSLYREGHHKTTFFYEGVSIFFLSLSAFSFLLRKKRDVLFSEEVENQES